MPWRKDGRYNNRFRTRTLLPAFDLTTATSLPRKFRNGTHEGDDPGTGSKLAPHKRVLGRILRYPMRDRPESVLYQGTGGEIT